MSKRQYQAKSVAAVAKKKESMSLFDEDVEENEDNCVANTGQLAVNKNYADRYNNWRGKEEMQKCTLMK